nr:hypothetical protein [Tanacetum cinerariifolium]
MKPRRQEAPTENRQTIVAGLCWGEVGKVIGSRGDANLLRDTLKITPIDQAHQFVSPPSCDAIMDFMNELGYTEVIYFLSRMAVNNLYQPWRAILSMINQCLTSKTSGFNRSRYPLLQMPWDSPAKKGMKDKPHVIPYFWFMKLIICHLGRIHNIHQRSTSPFHLAVEDLRLGNLKFVPKGEKDKVFGILIPNELISNNIRNASYYSADMEMVAKHNRRIAAEKEGKKKPKTAKQPNPKPVNEKSSKPAPVPKPKATKEKPAKPSPAKPLKMVKVLKTRKGKSSLQLIDEKEPSQPEPKSKPEHQSKATRPLPVIEGKGKAIVTEEQAAQSLLALHTPKKRITTDQFILQRWTPATEEGSTRPSTQPQDDASANIVHESPSYVDAERGADSDKTTSGGNTEILQIDKDQGNDVDNQVNLEEKTTELDQGQAGSNPDPRVSRVALAGPNPEPTNEEFMANMYPDVHGNLKLPVDEHAILEEPLSSSRTLSSMKNLDDAYTFRDQFLNDQSTKDEPGKVNMDSKVVSMVTVLIYQASFSVSPLSTLIIDLSPPKPVPTTTHAPIFTATTTPTTTTLPLLPPPPQQSTSDSELAACVTALEQKLAAFEQKSKTLDNTTHKIDQIINTVVKEAVHIALQAPLRDRFRELPEADMKEIIHQRMFKSGSYKLYPKHVALYEALEASMERASRDEFHAEKDKLRKRCHDNQDPPLPPSDSDLSKKRRHDSGALGSTQPQLLNPQRRKHLTVKRLLPAPLGNSQLVILNNQLKMYL